MFRSTKVRINRCCYWAAENLERRLPLNLLCLPPAATSATSNTTTFFPLLWRSASIDLNRYLLDCRRQLANKAVKTSNNQINSLDLRSSNNETVGSAYSKCLELFDKHQVPESELSARYIISKAMNIPYRHSVFLKSQSQPIDDNSFEKLTALVNRRLLREPIQYIVGDWDFFGLNLICRAPILIPRQETEDLADRIVKRLNSIKIIGNTGSSSSSSSTSSRINSSSFHVLDIGAGTGAIGLGILKELQGSTCIAIDLNNDAVVLSSANADRNKLASRYSCLHRSFADFAKEKIYFQKFDLVVSNPPYIPSADIPFLDDEVSKFEDIRALDGGDSGSDIIEDIILNCYPLFSEHGTKELWLEVSDKHPDYLQRKFNGMKLMGHNNVVMEVSTYNDLYEVPRFVVIKYIQI